MRGKSVLFIIGLVLAFMVWRRGLMPSGPRSDGYGGHRGSNRPSDGPGRSLGSSRREQGSISRASTMKEESTEGKSIYPARRRVTSRPRPRPSAKSSWSRFGIFSVVGCVGVGPGMSVRDYYSKTRVLMVSMGCSGVTNWIKPLQKYIFPIYPLYVDEAFALTRYFHENMKLTKIAMFLTRTTTMGNRAWRAWSTT